MISAVRRLGIALTGVLVASAGAALLVLPPATAAPTAGACSDSTGVTVVVDFASTGGGVQVRCAPAPVKNGFDALTRAGFSITNVSTQPGFLCRIDGKPADDPCNHTPSPSRYWSYWHAERGGAWIYSTSGGSRTPPPGSVDGWAFGASDPPSTAPPGPVATTTTTRPPPATATTTAPTAPGATPHVTGGDPPSTTAGEGTGTASTSPTEAPTGADSESTADTQGPSRDSAVDPENEESAASGLAANRSDDDAGTPAGVIVAALVASGLVAAGVRAARRRSRDSGDAA